MNSFEFEENRATLELVAELGGDPNTIDAGSLFITEGSPTMVIVRWTEQRIVKRDVVQPFLQRIIEAHS